MVEKAQQLSESTDWKSTADKLIALQKEWKTIGMVPRKLGDKLWNDFIAACNHFFEARSAAHADTRGEERENLSKKKAVIAKLKEMLGKAQDNAAETIKQLIEEYNAIGHVPFNEKDKLYAQFRDTVDKLYKELNISAASQKLDDFKSNLKNLAKKGVDVVDNERGKLMRRYEALKSEIQTYENNLGFLTAKSKKGNSLVDEMNRKVEKLKDDMQLVRQKIKAIDQQEQD